MPFTLHYDYALNPANPTYAGLRDWLIEVGEDDPLYTGESTVGLSVELDPKSRPVIGYGYDLEANASIAYEQLIAAGATINIAGTTAEQKALNLQNLINNYPGATTLAQLQAAISLPSNTVASNLLDEATATRTAELDAFLTDYGVAWLTSATQSQEYAVLLSMWYQAPGGHGVNGYFLNQHGQPSHMLKALISGNRAEVWYEIRFGSSQGKAGIAKRRYAESSIFGLYDDPSNVSEAEALQVYQMLANHRSAILKYEREFGTDPNGTNPTVASNEIAAANSDYSLSGSNAVPTLTRTLPPRTSIASSS